MKLRGGDDMNMPSNYKTASQIQYQFRDSSNNSPTKMKSSRRKAGSPSHSSINKNSPGRVHEMTTISPRSTPLPPPPGLKNVGNTCYANAALQCLLSTALPHALLDERNAQIIRKHSFNRNLLVYGSGSVDSEDSDADTAQGSCLTGMSNLLYDDEDEEVLSRALADDDNFVRRGPTPKSRRNKRNRRSRDEASVFSQSTVHSEMYQVVKKNLKDDEKGDQLSIWLTQELTEMTIDYTKPAKKSARASQRGFVGSLLGYNGSNNKPKNRVVDPGSITRKVHVISPTLRPYQQEDAHEFFRTLLSALTMHGRNPRLSSLFDGLLESSVTCQTCDKVSLTRDRYMDLSLDINSDSIKTLSDALDNFTQDEILDADNKVTCTRCKAKRVVSKGLRLATAPTMLVINYKRFSYDMYGRTTRISKNVSFPLRLEIKNFMSKANRGKPPPYSLVAVLVHKGLSCDRGHYIAYVRKGTDWYLANDEVVTKVELGEVLRAQAYVLVYEVEGMKEKHNFDCYSRYHESFDSKGGDDAKSIKSIDTRQTSGGLSMWDFSSLSNILDACDVGICGNPSNLMETTVEGRNAASKQTHNENDDLQVKPTRSYIEEFHLDAKTNESFEQKQYKRGRSYTPSQRRRNRDDEEKDEDSRNRSFNVYNDDDQRDDDSRRRTRSTSHFEKKSKGSPKGKSKEKSRPTKGPRRKNSNNSDRDGTALPPLQPRSNSPKKN